MLEKDPIKRADIAEVLQLIQDNQIKCAMTNNYRVSTNCINHTVITPQEHTRFEASKLTKMKSSSSLALNNSLGELNFIHDESEIEDIKFKQCEPEDVRLYLSLNQTQAAHPDIKRIYTRP